MFRSFVTLFVCTTVAATQCIAQSTASVQVPFVVRDTYNNPVRKTFNDLTNCVNAYLPESMYCNYLIGRALEAGVGFVNAAPDLDQALKYYEVAAQAGNQNAVYRLGYLLFTKRTLYTDGNGPRHIDQQQGRSWMHWATSHGFDPRTDAYVPPNWAQIQRASAERLAQQRGTSNSSIDPVTGTLLVLGGLVALGLAASSGDSKTPNAQSGTSSQSGQDSGVEPMKVCTLYRDVTGVPDADNFGGTHTEHESYTGYGYQCP